MRNESSHLAQLHQLLPGQDVLPVGLVQAPLVRQWGDPRVLDYSSELGQLVLDQQDLRRICKKVWEENILPS